MPSYFASKAANISWYLMTFEPDSRTAHRTTSCISHRVRIVSFWTVVEAGSAAGRVAGAEGVGAEDQEGEPASCSALGDEGSPAAGVGSVGKAS